MISILLVLVGAAIGSVARYALTFAQPLIIRRLPAGPENVELSWATILANVLASFLAGLLIRYFGSSIEVSATTMVTLLILGFCGGLSTMSSFALEILLLIRKNASVLAFGYLFFGVGIALFMFWLGLVVATVLSF